MTTRKRRTGGSPRSRRTSRYRSTSRRRVSPASTLGTAVGVALAGLLVVLVGGLPWWGWVLLVVVVLAVAAVWAVRRGRAAGPDTDSPAPGVDSRAPEVRPEA